MNAEALSLAQNQDQCYGKQLRTCYDRLLRKLYYDDYSKAYFHRYYKRYGQRSGTYTGNCNLPSKELGSNLVQNDGKFKFCFLKMNRSMSESDLINESKSSPTNYIATRNKSKRDENLQDDFEIFKEEIKLMISNQTNSCDSNKDKITSVLNEIKQTNKNIEASLTFLISQNEDLKKKVDSLETQIKKDKDYITVLEDKLEESQRAIRKTSIEIKNVPKATNETTETLVNYVCTLAQNIDCKLVDSDIRDIYRVQAKRKDKTNTSIIIETRSTILKSDIIKKAKLFNSKNKDKLRAKHLGFKVNENTPVYVSEQLTARGSRLFFLARDLARVKNYKFCWTSFGKVYVRMNEESRIITITNEAQIQNLMQAA